MGSALVVRSLAESFGSFAEKEQKETYCGQKVKNVEISLEIQSADYHVCHSVDCILIDALECRIETFKCF